MAKARLRGRDCGDLLSFEDVRRRLNLGTRLPVGRREVRVADIIGSVGRVHDFDGCFRPRTKGLRTAIRERAANPAVIDLPVTLLQVDHAYFVEDGHKRLSMMVAAGRSEVDADVDRFETDLPLAPGATTASIRATTREHRFRQVTGLAAAYPRKRFALSDPDGYLELEESVKAHTLDLSHEQGRLLTPEEGARHWHETVFRPVLDIIESTDSCRLLESTTEGDRFLLFRRGIAGPMAWGWRIPPAAVERGLRNVEGQARRGWTSRLPRRATSGPAASPRKGTDAERDP